MVIPNSSPKPLLLFLLEGTYTCQRKTDGERKSPTRGNGHAEIPSPFFLLSEFWAHIHTCLAYSSDYWVQDSN